MLKGSHQNEVKQSFPHWEKGSINQELAQIK